MDLLATVRKEGSRGGRGDFKWTDVQNSSHRENYLGHSVMAPVGRWQRGRDLGWYSKGDSEANEAERERKEELRRVKEAEQDAMARALGLPVPDRSNANLQEISNKRDFDRVVKEAADEESKSGGKGIGFSGLSSSDHKAQVVEERIEGNAEAQDKELQYALREYKRRHGGEDRRQRSRSRSRSRSRDRHRDRRDHHHRSSRAHKKEHDGKLHRSSRHEERATRQSRSRSRSRDRYKRRYSRSRSRDAERRRRHRDSGRDRSRSPHRRNGDGDRSERKNRYD